MKIWYGLGPKGVQSPLLIALSYSVVLCIQIDRSCEDNKTTSKPSMEAAIGDRVESEEF